MPSDKRNSITAKAMGLISSLFNVASSRDVPFHQSNAHIVVLQKLTFFLLYSFLHYRVGDDFQYHHFIEDLVTAVIAEVFNTIPFCL